MKALLFRSCIYAVLTLIFSSLSFAQIYSGSTGRKLQIDMVQDPPCPLEITVDRVDLVPKPEHILLRLHNRSSKNIRAYALISGGNRHPNLHTVLYPSKPFAPGTTVPRGIWPNSQEHYYFFFDLVLFDDGTTCGRNNHNRYIQISSYLEARSEAMAKLRQIVTGYSNSEDFIMQAEKIGFYSSFDNPGPPNPETIKLMPLKAYEHVVSKLREMTTRRVEAASIADRLEKETPGRTALANQR